MAGRCSRFISSLDLFSCHAVLLAPDTLVYTVRSTLYCHILSVIRVQYECLYLLPVPRISESLVISSRYGWVLLRSDCFLTRERLLFKRRIRELAVPARSGFREKNASSQVEVGDAGHCLRGRSKRRPCFSYLTLSLSNQAVHNRVLKLRPEETASKQCTQYPGALAGKATWFFRGFAGIKASSSRDKGARRTREGPFRSS